MTDKRVTLFAGHYGSGKTNIAVNYALYLRKKYDHVLIADLDIVNPYFRTKDSIDELDAADVKLISSEYANSNVDLPALPTEMYSITDDTRYHAVVDIGGDDRGAYALGRYTPAILAENDYEMLFVANRFRPLTTTVGDAVGVMREIEAACAISFTAIIDNSNLGEETTEESVISSIGYINGLSAATGLPVKFTSVEEKLAAKLTGKIENIFPMKLQKKYYDMKEG